VKKALLLLTPLLSFVLFVVSACGGQANAAEVVEKMLSAVDKKDVNGALAFVADDAVFEILGCPPGGCRGKAAVKGAVEGVIAQNPLHTVKSPKVSGDTATMKVEIVIDAVKAAGAERIVVTATVQKKDGKLVSFRAVPDAADQQTAKFLAFLALQAQPTRR
jgi:ketosteroid isomerase-like protein